MKNPSWLESRIVYFWIKAKYPHPTGYFWPKHQCRNRLGTLALKVKLKALQLSTMQRDEIQATSKSVGHFVGRCPD
jgi:hypothetical protein